jgi:flagellar protein FlaF
VNAATLAQRAYAPTNSSTRTPRSIEFEVIARITHRLKHAIKSRDFNNLVEALHENRTLWITIATNVADAENLLPEDLRARLFFLSEFTVQHTRKVLKKEATAVPLLEINVAILAGLQSEGNKP